MHFGWDIEDTSRVLHVCMGAWESRKALAVVCIGLYGIQVDF